MCSAPLHWSQVYHIATSLMSHHDTVESERETGKQKGRKGEREGKEEVMKSGRKAGREQWYRYGHDKCSSFAETTAESSSGGRGKKRKSEHQLEPTESTIHGHQVKGEEEGEREG